MRKKRLYVLFVESEDVVNIDVRLDRLSHQYFCNKDASNSKLEGKECLS